MENQRFEALTKALLRGDSHRGILRTLGVTGLGAGQPSACNAAAMAQCVGVVFTV